MFIHRKYTKAFVTTFFQTPPEGDKHTWLIIIIIVIVCSRLWSVMVWAEMLIMVFNLSVNGPHTLTNVADRASLQHTLKTAIKRWEVLRRIL
jgi:hypothetical protein